MDLIGTTSAVAIIALFDVIRAHGMPVAELETTTGISLCKMDNPDARITLSQFLKLWQIAVDLTNDPALGLHLRYTYGKDLMHFVVNLALNSSNMLEAMQHWIRYEKLISDTDRTELFEKEDRCIITYTNLSPEHENRWIPEHNISLALEYGRRITGYDLNPVEVRFRHVDPGYAEEYAKIFRCPVWFEQPDTSIVMRKKDLLRPPVTRDPYLQAVLKKHADASMRMLKGKESFQARVNEHIMKYLPRGTVDIESVSDAFDMDRSTLHRYLKKEGVTFRDLITGTRKKLAQNYLSQGLTATQITYLLGFSDPSTFQRAFKRWFGLSPGEFRKTPIDGTKELSLRNRPTPPF
jgi:AraC-like DNA-binding protein